jgi:glucose/arabinose dehydrogenase
VPAPRSVSCAAALAALALLAAAAPASAERYRAKRITSFPGTTYVTSAPGDRGRLFATTRAGQIRVVRRGKTLRRPFLDISGMVRESAQRGLLSMAFAPDYRRSRRFYVVYVTKDDTVQVDEYRRKPRNPDRASLRSRRAILDVGAGGDYHHGGQLQFGPDGYLWVSTGVGDVTGRAPDLGDLHGKLLRIDPAPSGAQPYAVPPDNPFVGVNGARPEIWAYGLRNPWRFSFDRLTGDLTIGDVGERTAEEVDYLRSGTGAGANFGFDVFEGNQQMIPGPVPERYVPPALEHTHSATGRSTYCALIGGYVVRDRRLGGLYGRYLYADLCKRAPRSVLLGASGATADRPVKVRMPRAVSFGEDGRGRLYAVGLNGTVYRLRAAARK